MLVTSTTSLDYIWHYGCRYRENDDVIHLKVFTFDPITRDSTNIWGIQIYSDIFLIL